MSLIRRLSARLRQRQARYAALNYPGHVNLGDEIQTIAAMKFLPRIDAWVARERLDEFSSDVPHKIILNGWFLHCPQHWPPSGALDPLIISFHLTREVHPEINTLLLQPSSTMLYSQQGLNYFKRNEPIGARDLDTLKQLKEAGVRAYFSGCLTLTLESPQCNQERTKVYAVDVPDEVFAHLVRTCDGPVTRLTHFEWGLGSEARFARASVLLKHYAEAKAVVSSRLHCALPCLAFGTPVLLVENATDSYRFDGLKDLLRSATVNDILLGRCDFDLRFPPPNGTKWQELRDDLAARCQAFIKG
jgi:hypothetical protein